MSINITTTIYCFVFIFFYLISYKVYSQREVKTGQLLFTYEIVGDSLHCFLSAPTQGWLLVGFNTENSTQQADFKFFAITETGLNYADYKNTDRRNYVPDTSLQGENNIRIHYYKENKTGSSVLFSIPLKTMDSNDFQHDIHKKFWLILAYSVADDFQHHSIHRKHLPMQWEPL